MFAELLQLIQKTACKAQAVEKIESPDPRVALYRVGETLEPHIIPPAFRDHRAGSLETFCRIVKDLPTGNGDIADATIWHNHNAVVCIFNDADRRERAVLSLMASSELQLLREMDREPLDQKTFIRRLKLDLGVPEEFVGKFRKISWTGTTTADGQHNRGADRMGADVRQAVAGIDDIPETYTLSIPLYQTDGLKADYRIPCIIEIDADPNERTITLATKPGAISDAIDTAQAELHATLVEVLDENTPIFYGSP